MSPQQRYIASVLRILKFLDQEWPVAEDLVGHKGGHLAVASYAGEMVCNARVGNLPVRKRSKCMVLAAESVCRLAQHSTHVLSFESRDPAVDHWGGAVRGQTLLYSLSGLTELLDEIAMLGLAMSEKDLTWPQVYALLQKHHPAFVRESQLFIERFHHMAHTGFFYREAV